MPESNDQLRDRIAHLTRLLQARAPESHDHTISDIIGLTDALAGSSGGGSGTVTLYGGSADPHPAGTIFAYGGTA